MGKIKLKNLNPYITATAIVSVLLILIAFSINGKTDTRVVSDGGHLRIVSLAPNVTEMLFALGLADSIVGVTDYCNYPPEAKQIECVGGLGSPNSEKLLTLNPDLVIATDFEHKQMRQLIRAAGIELLEVRIHTVEDVFSAMEKIGQQTGTQPKAERLVADLRAELARITAARPEKPLSERPRVFVEIWHDPITTAGAESFVSDVIRLAGGVNVADGIPDAYAYINPEKVIEWNPDVILTSYMISADDKSGPIEQRIGWSDIAAIKEKRIISDIPAELILRPGPRIIEGIRQLSGRLYASPTGDGWHGQAELDRGLVALLQR